MSNSNNSSAGGSAPFGRIAGVAILAGGVIALGVIAMNTSNRPVEPATPTQQVANQAGANQASQEPGLAQADLSRADQLASGLNQDRDPAADNAKPSGPQKEDLQAKQDAAISTAKVNPNTLPNSPKNPNSMVEFDTILYDFGNLYSTAPVDGKFVFTSTGTEPLIIDHVQTTCGCTAANQDALRNSSWEPGTSAEILFTFTPSNQAGVQRKSIRVHTNSESNPVVVLEFVANYIPSVKLSAQVLNLGRIESGNIGQTRVVIESRDPNFAVRQFDLGDFADQFTWSYTQLDPVNDDFPARGQLLIQTKPDMPVGPLNRVVGNLVIAAGNGEAAEQSEQSFNIVIRGEVVGQVVSEPRFGRSPLAQPGDAFEHTFTVKSTKDRPFNITDVKLFEGEAPNFSYEVAPVASSQGTAFTVTIRGNAPDRAGGYMGRVAIYTDIENHGPIQYQFTGVTRVARP